MDDERVTYLGEAHIRNERKRFGIRSRDRDGHMYILGKTGMGKSTLLEHMIAEDITAGEGVIFIDPHGTSSMTVLDHVPEKRINDVLYITPGDLARPVAFNILDGVDESRQPVIVHGLVKLFEKLWREPWSSKTERILYNALLALFAYPSATLLDIDRIFTDSAFRNDVLGSATNPSVRSFWIEEFPAYTDAFRTTMEDEILGNINRIISDPAVQNIIGHAESSFHFRDLMDQQKVVIINLAKGEIGEDAARFLGSIFVTRIYLESVLRADVHDFDWSVIPRTFLYVDEFQSISNKSFVNLFSEARKYKLALTVAHQYTGQVAPELREAILGNVGSIIAFCVGGEDGPLLEREFSPIFTSSDVCQIGRGFMYLKLMIDGTTSNPFSAETLPPLGKPRISHRGQIIAHSQKQFGVQPIVPWRDKNAQKKEIPEHLLQKMLHEENS